MNPERKTPSFYKYKMPTITAHEKKLRRLELLLIKDNQGFYLSHLATYLNESKEVTLSLLRELEAVEMMGGFWVHVIHRVPSGNAQKVDKMQCIHALIANPNMPIAEFMKKLSIGDPELLCNALQALVVYGVEKDIQHAARCYLLRKFNIEKNLVR